MYIILYTVAAARPHRDAKLPVDVPVDVCVPQRRFFENEISLVIRSNTTVKRFH